MNLIRVHGGMKDTHYLTENDPSWSDSSEVWDKWDNVTGIFLRPRGRSKSLWMQQPGNGAALKRAVTANLNG